ncbi:MAG: PKD domain-containing protein [Myxococcaceae bacterium]|nr:PKD domain-containing protein [Myxococcaceae bacterium]
MNIALDIANNLAALNPTSANLGLAFRELYQASPQTSPATFNFTLTAPPFAGPMTIFATGNAVDNNGATSGDRSANATKVVTIQMGSGAAMPVIQTPAAAMQSPLRTKATDVTVTAADDGGPTNLTYIWSATGPGAVVFSPNSTNAAATSRATFSRGGTYMVTCTVRDSLNQTVTSSFSLVVEANYTALKMTPFAVAVPLGGMQQFTAVAVDQFEAPIDPQPAVTYSVAAGCGTFPNAMNGLYRAQSSPCGPDAVVARAGSISTSSTVRSGGAIGPSTDMDAPAVALIEPQSGLPLVNGAAFEAIASDNIGILEVRFTIAEVPVATATSSPWRVTYATMPFLPGGNQPLVAIAKDLAGNETKSSSVIVVVPAPPTAGGSGVAGGSGGTAGGNGGGFTDSGGCACSSEGGSELPVIFGLIATLRRRRVRARRETSRGVQPDY